LSIGIGDTIADAATMEKINQTISKAKNDVKELIKQAHDKQLEAEAGRTMMESVGGILQPGGGKHPPNPS
jgi:DNA-directed RNA polymerase II subunit RPB1